MASALIILVPLFLGFAFYLRNPRLLGWINAALEWLVYLILGLLGISFGQLDRLTEQLTRMSFQVLILVAGLLVVNVVALWLWSRWQPMTAPRDDTGNTGAGPIKLHRLIMGALQPLLSVLAGVILGYFLLPKLSWVEDVASGALMLLLFLIGLQLRNAGLSLRRLLLNRQGLGIALTLAISSLLAGIFISPFLELSLGNSLALASGFGWYSLSGIVIGDALGPAWGGVAFLNDALREIIALIIIPMIIQARPSIAIGYGGATAMDFTLPVIRRSGGLNCVPVAIASGFILSFISPVLMGLFLAS